MPDELDPGTPQHFLDWAGVSLPEQPIEPMTDRELLRLIEKLRVDHKSRAELKDVLEIRQGLRTPLTQG